MAAPGQQSGFKGIAHTTNTPGTMAGVVTGMASRSNYLWLGSTYTKFYEHNGDKRPDVFDYSLVYGYRPPKWRRPPDKWDWRIFGELVGERSDRFLQNATVPNTQAHQVFLGPTALGIANAALGGHATLRVLVAVFRRARGFFLALAAATTRSGNSTLGCFAVRWCPWCIGWMRAASSSIRS